MPPPVPIRLPEALTTPDDEVALKLLAEYYGHPYGAPHALTGAGFDVWDSTGTRAEDANRFTADDLVALMFLSLAVPASTALVLLGDRVADFAGLLAEVGPDRDLADEEEPLHPGWPAWRLYQELLEVPGVGRTTASKLLARKRPRLLPVWDTETAKVTGARSKHWEPLRLALRADGKVLHRRLLRLRDLAGLPSQVSALRVFDVICWREGIRRHAATPAPRRRWSR
ncbi:DUF6308 family protein [Plantactinospora endophytica]|uniref:MarR family transcriptional regulator n=1 Tax=Plantactinospora endophytica TaxID=673535 RepID=A0ABQ4EFL4_9ACTN|nr:DUF6308 family protein [Plantactinospora endophytica]GIG93061.1 hypothetical protein Pen02_79970 [Plantactinospora endophytica]